MDPKIKSKKNIDAEGEQTVLFSDFLRLCGSAEKVSAIKEGDFLHLEGKFNLGGGRTMTLSTHRIILREGEVTLLPWR